MRGQLPGSARPESDGNKETAKSLDDFDEVVFLADRDHTCPVCRTRFTSKAVMSGKAKADGMDLDTRPRFKNVDIIKYRIIECPVCGYAEMDRYFNDIREKEIELIKEKNLRPNHPGEFNEISRDYPDAYKYYKSALRCALVRGLKNGRRGYIALNTAWLLRGWRENLLKDGYVIKFTDPMSVIEKNKLMKYALRNLQEAEIKESFPICGIDDATFDYLLAALCYAQDQILDSQRYLLRGLQNRSLKPVLRAKAEDLREMIREKKKNSPARIE